MPGRHKQRLSAWVCGSGRCSRTVKGVRGSLAVHSALGPAAAAATQADPKGDCSFPPILTAIACVCLGFLEKQCQWAVCK